MGGSQYQAKMLVEHLLPKNKYDIYYLARRVPESNSIEGYQVIKIANNSGFRKYGLFLDSIRLFNLLKEIKPAVIYQMVGSAYTGIASYYAKMYDCKMVWRITSDKSVEGSRSRNWKNFLPHKYLEKKITEYGIKNSQFIVAQTDNQATLLLQNFGRKPSAVIRNYHPEPKAGREKDKACINVVWVANFKHLKQPEVFIRLAREFREYKALKFIMVGAPAMERSWFKSLLKDMESLENLEYRGVYSQDNVNMLLSESHILVNTSQYEGFSNTFIQAWMREVAVVSLNSNPDNLLDNGFLGYCANGDYAFLTKIIDDFVNNPHTLKTVGARARAHALDAYSEKNIIQIAEIIENGF